MTLVRMLRHHSSLANTAPYPSLLRTIGQLLVAANGRVPPAYEPIYMPKKETHHFYLLQYPL